MHLFRSHGHLLGGTILIAATAIGVAMLALPISTGPGGFVPSFVVYLLCWAFMLCTGLLLLEVCAWMPPDSNLISMASRYLGRPGKIICWFVYLFLFETVMIAHITGGGNITSEILGGAFPPLICMVIYVLLFSPIVYLGTRAVDGINLCIFSGVIISYLWFIFVSYRYVNFSLLQYQNWSKAWLALPIIFAAFTYQVIIPTLMTYMNRNIKRVRYAIFFGTSIPLVVYLIWQILILGIVPVEGPSGLLAAKAEGQNAINPLRHFLKSSAVFTIGKAFGFFTMTASYIALSLAFLDFLADGLKVKKIGVRKMVLCLTIFVPPTVISIWKPHLFLTALEYAGGVSCAILFGLYPPLMVWVCRYKRHHIEQQQIPGGKPVLLLLILFVIAELCIELISQLIKK